MNSQTARTDFGVRETLESGGFSLGVVAEVLGRDEEDPGLDILVLGLACRLCCAEKVRRETDPFKPRWFWSHGLLPAGPLPPVQVIRTYSVVSFISFPSLVLILRPIRSLSRHLHLRTLRGT
jgi:hypothetical protein